MKPRLFLSLLFFAVSLVFTVMLDTSAFAQNNTDTEDVDDVSSGERLTLDVVLVNGGCDILEEFDAIAVPECDDSLDYQILTISFPPENLSGIFHRDTGIKPITIDSKLLKKHAEYLVQKNQGTQRGAAAASGSNESVIEYEIVKVVVHVEKDQCVFPEDLGLGKTDFGCKDKVILNVPISKLLKLSELDNVSDIRSHFYCSDCFPFPVEPIEPLHDESKPVSEQNLISESIITEHIDMDQVDYTSLYYVILIGVALTASLTVMFWRFRKGIKIEI